MKPSFQWTTNELREENSSNNFSFISNMRCLLLVTVILTLFCVIHSDDAFLNETIHIRVKRGKYYSYPSRFYRRPPMTYPTKGAFSYTPPPGYMMDDDEPPHPGRPDPRPDPRPKVSKRPNDGLRDEDINNIVKYLSKQDLDKLIDFASDKERIKDNSVDRRPYKRDESRVRDNLRESSPYKTKEANEKFTSNSHWISQDPEPQSFRQDVHNGPYRSQNSGQFTFKNKETDQIYNGPFAPPEDLLNLVEDATASKVIYINHDKPNVNLQTEDSVQNKQVSFLNTYIHHEINDLPNPANVLTDAREEILPRPVNLRDDDFDISYTNNVPTVVKGPSYKVESFGDLPLMSNAYKLDTVSSYKVPHYTVTSNSKYSPPPPPLSSLSSSSLPDVPLEPAPPVSAAREQSDAHLKAIKIWTHRSQGTAYTLHDDGTLSLERAKPKTKYGP